ncbi:MULTISPECIES: fasciclin domain-containing protein [Nesterenkonia]|uniref:Putative surface protein with fasciclin (FAS1) repeats n=2 Tax=Nesterenkonia TaxID=57494 RepID=A0A839FIT8_9MICC|nr:MULTISPECIES: fasciclin domain-containing protein [Nesterenkonia]MBA8921698.1 putative surface protein with fasciclin (FAS1) repeats [Nesterenkonia jeotgali]NYJ16743.1 putative surface protein with fasciclin (FAS1) repeats [Nesterenkonia sandarakina]
MKTEMRKTSSLLGIGMVALLGLSACGGDAEEPAAESDQEMTEETMESEAPMDEETESMESEEPMDEESESMDEADPAANLVGASCADYAEQVPEGDGSVEGMAQDPVATAASNNPMLTTLTAAVSGELNPDVDLVDTLNGDEFTVIAPTDDAFAAIPEEDLNAVVEDADMLTDVLTYHVIPGQLSPDEIAGEHETVNGATVTVEGEGDDLMFDEAGLVCGGVMTDNATVYMVDAVLMPAAAEE